MSSDNFKAGDWVLCHLLKNADKYFIKWKEHQKSEMTERFQIIKITNSYIYLDVSGRTVNVNGEIYPVDSWNGGANYEFKDVWMTFNKYVQKITKCKCHCLMR